MLDELSNDTSLNSTTNISIGENWLNKKNPFEYIVPPPSRGVEEQQGQLVAKHFSIKWNRE